MCGGIKLDLAALDRISRAAQDAALETIGATRGEIISAQVMPFRDGKMQNDHTSVEQFVDGDEIHTLLVTDTPYARRLYTHPEYDFQRGKNKNAQGEWLKPWLPGGSQEDYVPETFEDRFRHRMSE